MGGPPPLPPPPAPPPLRGVVPEKAHNFQPTARIPKVFRPKVCIWSLVSKSPKVDPLDSPPSSRYIRASSKNLTGPWNLGSFFGGKTCKKTPFLSVFLDLTRANRKCNSKKCAQSFSLCYCEHVDHFFADFERKILCDQKNSITSGSGFCWLGGYENTHEKKSKINFFRIRFLIISSLFPIVLGSFIYPNIIISPRLADFMPILLKLFFKKCLFLDFCTCTYIYWVFWNHKLDPVWP